VREGAEGSGRDLVGAGDDLVNERRSDMRFRISIAGLLFLILFLAVAFASLHEATDAWAKAMFTLAIALYGVVLLGLLFRRGVERATWTGSFLFGAGYLGLCYGPGCHTLVMPRLLTTALIDDRYQDMDYSPKQVDEKVWAETESGQFLEGRVFDISAGPGNRYHIETVLGTTARYGATKLRAISLDAYRQLCHADLSLLLAFIGGIVARSFATRDDRTLSR
jgi:uncharacterized integral membrane protein